MFKVGISLCVLIVVEVRLHCNGTHQILDLGTV
jgi:hypothetical protein